MRVRAAIGANACSSSCMQYDIKSNAYCLGPCNSKVLAFTAATWCRCLCYGLHMPRSAFGTSLP